MKTSRKSRIKELTEFDGNFDGSVIGTDEAGRGPLAGPVVASAVYFPKLDDKILEVLKFIDDSKKFSSDSKLRKELAESIKSVAKYAVKECSSEEIDKINILRASLLAMKKSCEDLINQSDSTPEKLIILVDGTFIIPEYNYRQKAVKKGDTLSASIAAASILAKVHRDEIMLKFAKEFPHYGWETNKGYPTSAHREALRLHGACRYHRKTFLSKIFCEQKKIF